ncbi:hypothetical protein VFPPC_11633 [Pochonia chlamydosporia 170]|uniref:Uncharacterized protein n=1 Tax=Pochonia chlamydosporia 170 TaxID=1380566 RepID=A0A179EZM1_METCM|nr:hypothetical protein VFPPC_11633 [Pochonia chlamydosporia 170]OAQ58293.1 hypothetical protein VFPPC_11633 [Pochonia chlamydosporia 170]
MDNPVELDALIAACQDLKAEKIRYLVVGNVALRANDILPNEKEILSFDIAVDDVRSAKRALVQNRFVAVDKDTPTSSLHRTTGGVRKLSAKWLPSSPVILLLSASDLIDEYTKLEHFGQMTLVHPSLKYLPGVEPRDIQDVVIADRNILLRSFMDQSLHGCGGREDLRLVHFVMKCMSRSQLEAFREYYRTESQSLLRNEGLATGLVNYARDEAPPAYSDGGEGELPSYSDGRLGAKHEESGSSFTLRNRGLELGTAMSSAVRVRRNYSPSDVPLLRAWSLVFGVEM